MSDSPDLTARIYTDTAEVVSRALQLLRDNSCDSATDQRILRDLENVHAGLMHEAAAQRGECEILLCTAGDSRQLSPLAPMWYMAR